MSEAKLSLTKDLRQAAKEMTDQEARYLVDMYYTVQEYRKATANQIRSMEAEPTDTFQWFHNQHTNMEENIKKALDVYTSNHPIGKWMKSIKGIGPVTSAGLLAHIDITKAPTVGHIWSYAGLNPDQKWEKGQLRPWNAELKKLCWLIGESFVKSSNRGSFYGEVYRERKEYETKRNERQEYATQAAETLQSKKIGKTTEAFGWYSKGMLPPARINERAKRYAVKLFLSHLHEVWYTHHYGEKPPKPYAIAHAGHAHVITPPNLDYREGEEHHGLIDMLRDFFSGLLKK